MRVIALSLAAALAMLLRTPLATPAHACGGFFCNAQTPVPIVQAGERVLLAPHDGLVTMHIEIIYQGDPTQFGWILPVAELPVDAAGRPLPLDKAVEISSQLLFTQLQAATDPVFTTVRDPNDDTVCAVPTANGVDSVSFDTTSSDASADASLQPPVVVLEEAAVGPYDAQLIQADRSDALYEWLGRNGYIQDPKAQPILDHYVQKGFKFIGIRLQSGKTTGDLRPLAISLGEDAPCVPLVLTQIAATPDMPILVWVLGDARAIPKNFIHALVDDRAIQFPSGANYQQVVTDAIIASGRRAWVTEYSGPATRFSQTWMQPGLSTVAVSQATSLRTMIDALSGIGIGTTDVDFQALLRSQVPLPSDLRGFPFGNCYMCQGCDVEEECAAQGSPNAEHVTTDAELYNFIDYWADLDADGTISLGIDMPKLVQAVEAEIITPRRNIAVLFDEARVLTRFFTLIDPEDMTRDPVFAFNPDLPEVSNTHTAIWDLLDCEGNARVTFERGNPTTLNCQGCAFGFGQFGPVAGASALYQPEILDEEGAPIAISLAQVAEVDALLDNARPGIPTLPANFNADPNPPFDSDPGQPLDPGTPANPNNPTTPKSDDGCHGGGAGSMMLAGLALLALAARRSFQLK